MSVTSDLIRGNTDTIILSCLENGDSYGYGINKRISSLTGGEYELKEATLYTAFKRLEENGCIVSYWGEEASGARRRYYKITDTGRKILADLRSEWNKTKTMIDKLTQNEEKK